MVSAKREFWAAWHPEKGFADAYHYESSVAWCDLDGAVREVRERNESDDTNNRNGWRAVKVTLQRTD